MPLTQSGPHRGRQFALQQPLGHLLDHLVGVAENRRWYVQADCLCSLEVDHQLELDRGLAWKLVRFRALEDAIETSARVENYRSGHLRRTAGRRLQ